MASGGRNASTRPRDDRLKVCPTRGEGLNGRLVEFKLRQVVEMTRLIRIAVWVGATLVAAAAMADLPAPPDAAAQERAQKLVRDLFKDAYTRKAPADRVALVKVLRMEAERTSGDLAGKFVLLREARDIAAGAGDFAGAMEAVDDLNRAFAIDAVEMKLTTLRAASRGVNSGEGQRSFVRACFVVGGAAAEAGNFDAAVRAAAMAEPVARATRDPVLVSVASAQSTEYLRAQKDAVRAKSVQERVDANRATAEDYLMLGEFLCFTKGDWARGLPLLVKSSNAGLKELAVREGTATADAAAQRELANAWWDLAEKNKGLRRGRMRRHAAAFYQQALDGGGLRGLERTRAEKRVAVAAAEEGYLPEAVGEPRWISKTATYTMSAEAEPDHPALPNLLDGRGGGNQNNGFAFHTKDVNSPYITIDLGATARIARLEISNRRDDPGALKRAKTLAVWTSSGDAQGPWRLVWEAAGAEKEWTIELPTPVAVRYVKIGLREKNPLHLFAVKIFGWDGN
ncbi:MAG: hypothetical protein JWN40_5677 [Phycisphaerales bacterium]|nr:hypothetical protein [Phycisphaerales bacterium]